ncbi:MAG TPA: hypothetical protein VGF48_17695 [Thermoanaerobaculia bacterium]|jgi:hypothetical protein
MRLTAGLLLSLIALPLHADALTDVRSALGRFAGRAAIRASYDVHRIEKNEGKLGNESTNGKVSVEVEGDANGFRVIFPRPLLDAVEREKLAETRNAKATSPTVNALREVDPVAAANAVDFAPELLRLLDGAKVVEEKAGAWNGKPARTVTFGLTHSIETDGAGKMTVAQNKLTLWLDANNVPLGGEHHFQAKFSFLIFKGESKQQKKWQFAGVGDRLVRLRQEEQNNMTGMGQKQNEQTVATVRVHG